MGSSRVTREYQQLVADLEARQIWSYLQDGATLVLSRQVGPAWPDRGNSFWACRLEGRWYVGTWSPRHYRLSDESKLAEFCEAFVDVGTSAQYAVPPELVARFGLVEVDFDEFERLYAAVRPPE
jgi:hypothetical protein